MAPNDNIGMVMNTRRPPLCRRRDGRQAAGGATQLLARAEVGRRNYFDSRIIQLGSRQLAADINCHITSLVLCFSQYHIAESKFLLHPLSKPYIKYSDQKKKPDIKYTRSAPYLKMLLGKSQAIKKNNKVRFLGMLTLLLRNHFPHNVINDHWQKSFKLKQNLDENTI